MAMRDDMVVVFDIFDVADAARQFIVDAEESVDRDDAAASPAACR